MICNKRFTSAIAAVCYEVAVLGGGRGGEGWIASCLKKYNLKNSTKIMRRYFQVGVCIL